MCRHKADDSMSCSVTKSADIEFKHWRPGIIKTSEALGLRMTQICKSLLISGV